MYNGKCAVLVPPCLLAPGLQASKPIGSVYWGKTFIELMIKYEVDIISYPCAEVTFNGYDVGLQRKKHGIDYYISLNGFSNYCSHIASEVEKQIIAMLNNGIQFVIVLGVEHSPNCAVNYLYTHKGMLKRSGLFVSELKDRLIRDGIDITFIGINRKYPRKALEKLESYFLSQLSGESELK